jgi:hypothetical protein
MPDADAFEVGTDEFAVIGRTFAEYRHVFDLDPDGLVGETVLDCPAGVGSFVAEATDRGIQAVGADVLYDTPPTLLARRSRHDFHDTVRQVREKRDLFVWNYYEDVAARRARLRDAHERFLRDYETGRSEGRYLPARLPHLPFPDDSFPLVLSAHLLFLYADRLSHEFHREALDELCRVSSDEVRVFPLVGLDTEPYDGLDGTLADLRDAGHEATIESVPFEFQQGATEMLRVSV